MLAVVAVYFNPCGYASLKDNFLRFRQHMLDSGADLVVCELSYDGQYVIPGSVRIQQHPSQIMWQKERLINLVVELLPEKYTQVAWIDGDVIFQSPDWLERTRDELEFYQAVQLFARVVLLRPDGSPYAAYPSFGYCYEKEKFARCKTGYAWAAHRNVFPLIDRLTIVGADNLMAHAWAGEFSASMMGFLNRPMQDAYLADAWDAWTRVRGCMGSIAGEIHTLWHGIPENRGYCEQAQMLGKYGFDPNTSIRLAANGLYEWDAASPELRAEAAVYFAERKDDDGT